MTDWEQEILTRAKAHFGNSTMVAIDLLIDVYVVAQRAKADNECLLAENERLTALLRAQYVQKPSIVER